MFRGSSSHTIDAKGRIIIPTRFRDVIKASGESALMLSRMDGCLFAYTLDEWRAIEGRILSMSEQSESMRRFRRVFIGGAFECVMDKQGRVLVPPSLRRYADLEKEIVLVGVLNRFEIWSEDRWDAENQKMEADLKGEGTRNDVAQLGL